jgi:hypothetical protein
LDNPLRRNRAWEALASIPLTIVCLSLLMVLVVLCTLAQVHMGTLGAVNTYMRSFFLWMGPIPVFPGGALVGLVLIVNLVAALVKRIPFTWSKTGLWLIHAGLILLVAGEFMTGLFQVETRMAIDVGETINYVDSAREMELAVLATTDQTADEAWSVPESRLSRGGSIALPGTPVSFQVKRFFANADFADRQPTDPPSVATMGYGRNVNVKGRPRVVSDAEMNRTSVYVEPVAKDQSHGVWLVSAASEEIQSFTAEGRTYLMAMRPRRTYLPYSLTLKKFSHDVYPGTDIPKNFSSLVHLSNPGRGEERDVIISMNQPLRYAGRAFYQASYGKGGTMSVLQVVENPGWLLPYVSCALVTLGLLLHFVMVFLAKRKSE